MAPTESTDRTVRVRDCTFRVTTSESPAHTRHPAATHTVVLVHGIGISSRAFAPLHDVLARYATVHSIDLPGFGRAPKPRRSLSVAEMARLLAVVVESLGREPVIAVGNSMGTQWVVELARQRPDLVTHAVAIGPVVDEAKRSALAQAIALLVDSTRESRSANAMVLREYLRCGPRWYLRQLPHMLRYRIEDRVAELHCPLLIIRGERDPIASAEWCARVRDAGVRAQLAQIPGQPHLAQYTAPRAVAREISRFVEREHVWA